VSILLQSVVKSFGPHRVVDQVSLEVTDGELFVLLGPSGSGKSTVLRMIAGLAELDSGRVLLHGRDVTTTPPQRRAVGFVFQHYALFRHMTVAENIEFSLRIRKVPRLERRRRRDELLELVGLVGFHDRFPRQLSGGQQQRVALARALAHRPEVLLLDEPFGALDAKIRADLRRTVRGIQRELGVATIFVTHDQEEAFELADRLGVMSAGHLLEVGAPEELYLRPQTEFVATFLGSANLMVGERSSRGVRLGPVEIPLGTQGGGEGGRRRVQVLFRPEDVAVKDSPEALDWPLLGEAVLEESEFVGPVERLRLRLPPLAGVRPISPATPYGGDYVHIDASRSQHQSRRFPLKPGDTVWVGVRRVHALTHPGLGLLLAGDGSPRSAAALQVGAAIGRRAQARVVVLAPGDAGRLSEEAARHHYDLVVQAQPAEKAAGSLERVHLAEPHHLLLVPPNGTIPSRALISVAVGEPGKECVRFAARLLRHLGASSTLLAVLPEDAGERDMAHAQRFLSAGVRTMALSQVPARISVRTGPVVEQILEEMNTGGHDLLVVGSPPPESEAHAGPGLVVRRLLEKCRDRSMLIVRSQGASSRS